MKRSKLTCFLAALLLFTVLSSPVSAAPSNDTTSSNIGDTTLGTEEELIKLDNESKGKIIINLEEAGKYTSVKDVEFAIYKIADVVDGQYVMNDKYNELELDLNEIKTSNELDETSAMITNYLVDNNLLTTELYQSEKTTDENGQCQFTDLQIGVYLVHATDTTNYDDISSFIIAIPTFSDAIFEMIYDVEVYPKHTPKLTTIQIHKVDASDNTKVLPKAGFTLFDEQMNELEVVESGKDGLAIFEDVPFGKYYLKETSAPKGYRISDELVEVIIDGTYSAERIYEIEFPNALLPILSTGDTAPIGLYFVIAAISFTILLSIHSMKKQALNKQ